MKDLPLSTKGITPLFLCRVCIKCLHGPVSLLETGTQRWVRNSACALGTHSGRQRNVNRLQYKINDNRDLCCLICDHGGKANPLSLGHMFLKRMDAATCHTPLNLSKYLTLIPYGTSTPHTSGSFTNCSLLPLKFSVPVLSRNSFWNGR